MIFKDWLHDLEYEPVQGSLDAQVLDVIYDSRKAAPGMVFVCIQGTKQDSHDFISQAAQAGVSVFVVEKETVLPPDVTAIRVKNGRRALALISAARFRYPAEKMVTIGVTGTKGKTTTTHMIKAILEAAGKKVGMIGTTGAVIGDITYPTVNTTPESYQLHQYFDQMVQAGCQYLIMEVSSQGIKMHRTDGISFDYGIFTNISPDHIGPNEHENFEEYLSCKSRMLQICKVGLVNRDDEHYEAIVKEAGCRLYTYSLKQEGDFTAKGIHFVSQPDFVGLEFLIKGRMEMEVKVNIPGEFNVSNALAAFSISSFLDLPEDKVRHALEHLRINGRMEIVHSSSQCTVIVDYAHNAVSMESLLLTLRDYQPKRLVVVFGCGGNRSKDRRYSMGEIAGRLADLSVVTADNSRWEKVEDIIADIQAGLERTKGSYVVIPDRREAIIHSIVESRPGDMIAVVGKGHEDYQEIEGIRYPFLDRGVVEEAVELLKQRD